MCHNYMYGTFRLRMLVEVDNEEGGTYKYAIQMYMYAIMHNLLHNGFEHSYYDLNKVSTKRTGV